MSSESVKCLSNKLENIDENAPANWLPSSVHPPETPTESLEFLARSWSLSATELSKALITTSNVESNIFDKASATTCMCSRDANDVLNNMHFKDTVRSYLVFNLQFLYNAQLHAAVSVAGVAAAVAALTASHASATDNSSMNSSSTKAPLKMSAAIASAAALVASHCIEIAEEMGADHHQILTVVDSINIQH